MAQLNMILTTSFEKELKRYMKIKGFAKKSEALRQAISDALKQQSSRRRVDFRKWRGLALKAPLNSKPRFKNEDELWN